jgi:hypothetical protein
MSRTRFSLFGLPVELAKIKTKQAEQAAEKVLSCHPERSEGSAFLRQTQEKADSSVKPSPSE